MFHCKINEFTHGEMREHSHVSHSGQYPNLQISSKTWGGSNIKRVNYVDMNDWAWGDNCPRHNGKRCDSCASHFMGALVITVIPVNLNRICCYEVTITSVGRLALLRSDIRDEGLECHREGFRNIAINFRRPYPSDCPNVAGLVYSGA